MPKNVLKFYYFLVCFQPPYPGPCDGSFKRWYYDFKYQACDQFIYGGCGGFENNFETECECLNRCSVGA